jgi:O-antigen/teichoic acid export membrane protein
MNSVVEMRSNVTDHSDVPIPPKAGSGAEGVDGIFALDGQSENLRSKTIRGGAVTFTAQGIRVVLNVASTVFLARLLTPYDFGMISMVTGVTGFVEAFKDAGLSLATIQRERITQEQVSTLFWVNVGLSAFLMVIVLALSPALATFYHEPSLAWVAAAISITFLLGGLAVQHQALLRRNLRFRQLAVIDVISLGSGIVTGIVMASMGFRYWALVWMNLVTAATNVIAVWIALPWRPGVPKRHCGVRPMITFGGSIVATRFIFSFVSNTPNILIGWYWGAGAVGLYQKAYSLLMFAIDQIHGPVAAVALSPLSRVQSDAERFRRYFLAGYSIVISLALPLVVVSAVFSEEIIRVVLGPRWNEAVEVFRWLAVGSIFVVLLNPLGMVLQASGRAVEQVKITIVDSSLIIIAYVAGVKFGPIGVAIGFVIMRALLYIPISYAMLRGSGIGLAKILQTVLVPLVASAVAIVVGIVLKLGLRAGHGELVIVLLGTLLMSSTYAFILLVVFKKWAFYRGVLLELIPAKLTSISGRFARRTS